MKTILFPKELDKVLLISKYLPDEKRRYSLFKLLLNRIVNQPAGQQVSSVVSARCLKIQEASNGCNESRYRSVATPLHALPRAWSVVRGPDSRVFVSAYIIGCHSTPNQAMMSHRNIAPLTACRPKRLYQVMLCQVRLGRGVALDNNDFEISAHENDALLHFGCESEFPLIRYVCRSYDR